MVGLSLKNAQTQALQKSLRLDLVSLGAAVNALSSTWRRAQDMGSRGDQRGVS